MIKIFPDFVVAVQMIESILRSTYTSSLSPDYKVNESILRSIFEKVAIYPTKCIVDQHKIQNKGINGIVSGYQPDMWNTRHYREYFSTLPELFVPSEDKDYYTLNMKMIKKEFSLEKTIRENAYFLCKKMLNQGHYNKLLMIRYGFFVSKEVKAQGKLFMEGNGSESETKRMPEIICVGDTKKFNMTGETKMFENTDDTKINEKIESRIDTSILRQPVRTA